MSKEKVRYVVRLEVEKIVTYPDGEEDFQETDSAETAGSFDSFEEAVNAQSDASTFIKKDVLVRNIMLNS